MNLNSSSLFPDRLKGDLERTRKKWKIIVFHRPPYCAEVNRPDDDLKDAFCQEENHVDLVINGHDHEVMCAYPIADGRIAGPAGGNRLP
ncbi:MAG TPA: hypothetical protein GXX19_03200 [Syntrophomonadaceae bacterium]|nr:hypothetical protein [Syntrophomonadaceae bacterium]